jgi:hypothetical protein
MPAHCCTRPRAPELAPSTPSRQARQAQKLFGRYATQNFPSLASSTPSARFALLRSPDPVQRAACRLPRARVRGVRIAWPRAACVSRGRVRRALNAARAARTSRRTRRRKFISRSEKKFLRLGVLGGLACLALILGHGSARAWRCASTARGHGVARARRARAATLGVYFRRASRASARHATAFTASQIEPSPNTEGMYEIANIGATAKNARCAATPIARPASGTRRRFTP